MLKSQENSEVYVKGRTRMCNSPTSKQENLKWMSAETQMVSPSETDFAVMQFVQTSWLVNRVTNVYFMSLTFATTWMS